MANRILVMRGEESRLHTLAEAELAMTNDSGTERLWVGTNGNGNVPLARLDELSEVGGVDLSGYVPTTRTVNGKALSSNISLTASDVGAATSGHTHTKSDIADFPTTMTPSNHTHGSITNDGKIGTTSGRIVTTGAGGVLQAQTIANAGVAAASHTHSTSALTSGVLPVTRGGTGATTAATALTALGAASSSHTHNNATQSAAGFMSAADKQKLDGIEAGATAGGSSGITGIVPIANGGTGNSAGYIRTGQKSGTTIGRRATAEGRDTTASADESHAEGCQTQATAYWAHAEGYACAASGDTSHAEGDHTTASGVSAHAEGVGTTASGDDSHAEGNHTTASGQWSHAEGDYTVASGLTSHAGGRYTIASKWLQTAIGEYNVETDGYFIIGRGSNSARSNAFRVAYTGVYGFGAYNSSGADYAEMFEWADGNPDGEDRAGLFVTLDGEKIRLAEPKDSFILGVVSGNPSVCGDVYDDQWQGMYETDVFGRPIWEEVEVPEETREWTVPAVTETRLNEAGEMEEVVVQEEHTETIVVSHARTERRQKLNPNYDGSRPYQARSERPEWDAVGLLGKLVAVDDGNCTVNGWAAVGSGGAATASAERTNYRVMARLDDTHIKLLVV